MNKTYNIRYITSMHGDIKSFDILAPNKKAAYCLAMDKLNYVPYAAWVNSVTYNNGKRKLFETFPGKPY